jgi:hypothetical protein
MMRVSPIRSAGYELCFWSPTGTSPVDGIRACSSGDLLWDVEGRLVDHAS